MSKLRFDAIPVAAFVADHLQRPIVPPFTAIGVERRGDLVAGAVFNNYNRWNIDVTVYGPGAFYRGVMRALAHYAFVQLKVGRVTASTQRDNIKAQTMLLQFGFKKEAEQERYFGPSIDQDAFVYRMTIDDLPPWARDWTNT